MPNRCTSRIRCRQRGAALLTAMIIVTMVATLAASMIWQQWRAVQVETAERARSQSAWILAGALDWSRLILLEDAKSGKQTALTEPWAVPLAEARLSSFLAADKNNNAADEGPEAFLSGFIVDAQARYNLRSLINPKEELAAAELAVFKQICQSAGVASEVADRIAAGMRQAVSVPASGGAPAETVLLLPRSLDQLSWFGIDRASVRLLEPFVMLLPSETATKVNVNTASREVLAAVAEISLSTAEQILQLRKAKEFLNVDDARLPKLEASAKERLTTLSEHFEVWGRLRLVDRVLEERSIVRRNGNTSVQALSRERVSSIDPVRN